MTNPDNVGGLPERWRGLADKCEAEFPQKAQIFRWCANELCRAAPAGGDVPVAEVISQQSPVFPTGRIYSIREIPNMKHLLERLGDGAKLYARPKDSAPAGSGEVAKALEVVEAYGKLYGQLSGHTIVTDLLNDYAALLRKLQQGADYEPAFWNVRKDGKHLILFPLNGAVTITAYLEMVAGANPGSAIDAETLYRAASPGKEAFNG